MVARYATVHIVFSSVTLHNVANSIGILAFQTAVALAEAEETKDDEGKLILHESHLRSIVRMSGAFKKYLDTLHQGDENQRAAREGLRIDDYEEGKHEREKMG